MSNYKMLVGTPKHGALSPELDRADTALELINIKDVQRCIEPAMKGRRLDLAGGGWEIILVRAVEEAMKAQPQRSIRAQLLKECLRNAYEAANTMPETMSIEIRDGGKDQFVTDGESWLLRISAKKSLTSVIERALAECLENGLLTLVGGLVEITAAGRSAIAAEADDVPSHGSMESNRTVPARTHDRDEMTGGESPELPKKILHSYKDMLAELELKSTNTALGRLKYANKHQQGPIIVGKKGEKPWVDARLLVKWWNSLLDRVDAAAATAETAIERPKNEILWDGGKRIGHVKESQRTTGHLARHDTTSRNISKRQ